MNKLEDRLNPKCPNPWRILEQWGGRSWFSANKWKLLQFEISFTDPTARIFIEGMEIDCRSWGETTPYRKVSPFGEEGGYGGQS